MSGVNSAQNVIEEAKVMAETAEKIARLRGERIDIDPSLFKQFVAAGPSTAINLIGADVQTLLWGVPPGMDCLITTINLRTIDGTNKLPSMDDFVGITSGGFGTMYLKRNGTAFTQTGISALNFANRPILLLLNAGDLIGVIVNITTSISALSVATALHGFLVPTVANLARWFAPMQTTIVNTASVRQGSSGSGTVIVPGTTPF